MDNCVTDLADAMQRIIRDIDCPHEAPSSQKMKEEEMPKLNMAVPHGLTQDEAIKRVKNLLNKVKTQFADEIINLREEWDGNKGKFHFSVRGFSVSGTLIVKTSRVEISGVLPFAAMLFRGKIESMIKDHTKTLLA